MERLQPTAQYVRRFVLLARAARLCTALCGLHSIANALPEPSARLYVRAARSTYRLHVIYLMHCSGTGSCVTELVWLQLSLRQQQPGRVHVKPEPLQHCRSRPPCILSLPCRGSASHLTESKRDRGNYMVQLCSTVCVKVVQDKNSCHVCTLLNCLGRPNSVHAE